MGFSKRFHWIFVTWICCNLHVSGSLPSESAKQRKPFFERLRRLEEQFRRFQDLSLTRLQIISENFNVSSNVDLRLQSLTDQFNNINATANRFHTAAESDIGSLKSWVKKLQKKAKKIDLKMSTLEKVLNERSKQVSRDKKEQDLLVTNLTRKVEEQREAIGALAAGRIKLQKEMEGIRDEVKGQGVKVASFEEQMTSALQNDALSVKPSPMQSAAATAPLGHRAKSFNQAPSTKQPLSKKEGSICNVNSVMHFPNSSTENYATFGKGFSTGLFEMTICSWLRTKSNYLGTMLSYATEDNDNKLVLHGRNTSKQTTIHFVIGDPAFRELPVIPLLDGRWHHICIIWSSFEDIECHT
ncbi:pentraxin-4 isoform X2 [Mustelus asterias]